MLVEALSFRAVVRVNLGDVPGGVDDARSGLALARDLGDAASELFALTGQSVSGLCRRQPRRSWTRPRKRSCS